MIQRSNQQSAEKTQRLQDIQLSDDHLDENDFRQWQQGNFA